MEAREHAMNPSAPAYVSDLLSEIDWLRDLVWRLRPADEFAAVESRLVRKWLAPGEGKGDMGG